MYSILTKKFYLKGMLAEGYPAVIAGGFFLLAGCYCFAVFFFDIKSSLSKATESPDDELDDDNHWL